MPLPLTSGPNDEAHLRGPTVRSSDVLFGLVVPLVCIILDQGMSPRGFVFGRIIPHPILARVFCGIEMAAFGWWLFRPPTNSSVRSALAGAFWIGALGALVVGIVIAPFAIAGLLALIGVLGFSPFLAFWVYARNARRAWVGPGQGRWIAALAGAAAVPMLSLLAYAPTLHAARVVDRLANDPAMTVDSAVAELHATRWCFDTDLFVDAYGGVRDSKAEMRLEEAYRRLTGNSLIERYGALRSD